MNRFTYPAMLVPDEVDGGFTVLFRDVPEAITQGDTVEECLREAADCLEEALVGRIRRGDELPIPSQFEVGEKLIPVPIQTAMKAALYQAMKEVGISKSELARKIGTHENVVRRILDPHHGTKFPTMERALSALGKHAELHIT
jgi:antitoxin HicB